MLKIFSGAFLSLISFLAHAAVSEDGPAVAELPPPDATGLVGFLLVMVAMVAGYVWYIRKEERKRKQREAQK